MVVTPRFTFFRFRKPNPTARGMNSMDAMATDPLAAFFTISPSAPAVNPAKVPATISANAATTKISTSHANTVNIPLIYEKYSPR